MAKNTTKTINEPNISDAELARQIKEAGQAFKDEKQVKVSIPKTLEKEIGQTLPIGINGVFIVLPVDGEEYAIPETFAKHLKDYLKNL